MLRLLKRRRTWVIISLLLLTIPIVAFKIMEASFEITPDEMTEYFKEKPQQPNFSVYTALEREVFYAETGSDTNQMVLFVHGAPGSWDAFMKYLGDTALMRRAHLVSVDRPGYGKSGLGQSVISIEEQSAMIAPLLFANKSGKPAILVGHSYGGPVIARMAMDYPEKVGALVLLAPAIDPEHEKLFLINYPANWKVFRWMVPAVWRVSNDEKLSHAAELEKMVPLWANIQIPCTYMYGEKDGLVPTENVTFARKMLVNAPLNVIAFPKENHFIPWTQQDSVTKVIMEYLDR